MQHITMSAICLAIAMFLPWTTEYVGRTGNWENVTEDCNWREQLQTINVCPWVNVTRCFTSLEHIARSEFVSTFIWCWKYFHRPFKPYYKRWTKYAGLFILWFHLSHINGKVFDSTAIYPVHRCYDIAWWRHQMETFSVLLAICAGNSPVAGEFPTQRPMTRSFYVFFDRHLNKRLSKRSWGWWFEMLLCSLWCHCNGYEPRVRFRY